MLRRPEARWTIGLSLAFALLAAGCVIADHAWHTAILTGLATCWSIAASAVAVHPLTRRRRRYLTLPAVRPPTK